MPDDCEWSKEEWAEGIKELGDQVDKELQEARDAYEAWKDAVENYAEVSSNEDASFEDLSNAFGDELSAESKFDKEYAEYDNVLNEWNNNVNDYLEQYPDGKGDITRPPK